MPSLGIIISILLKNTYKNLKFVKTAIIGVFIRHRGAFLDCVIILKHLGLLDELPHAHDPPSTPLETLSLRGSTEPPEYDITYEPIYDDLTLSEQIELLQGARRF